MPLLTADDVCKRMSQLETSRSNWEDLWERTAEIVLPMQDDFRRQRTPGERRDRINYNAVSSKSNHRFAAVLEWIIAPRSKTWHTLRCNIPELNKDTDVKRWFEEVNRLLFLIRGSARANFYGQVHEGYLSLGAFGNMCLYVEEDDETVIRYRNFHIGRVFVSVDHHGRIDSVYRKIDISAKAAFTKWGERTPERVTQALEKNPEQMFHFVHAVVPNWEVDPQAVDWRAMPFTSYEVCRESTEMIRMSGYNELPYLWSRYAVASGEYLGHGPAQIILAAIMGGNQMKRDYLRAGHLAVQPPILTHDDSDAGQGAQFYDLRPGAVNHGMLDSQMRAKIQPFNAGTNLPEMQFMLEGENDDVKDAFLVPLYEALLENPQMTATQVLELVRQNAVYLAPLIGRQQNELLDPLIARELGILARRGLLPPPPPALIEAEGEYETVYDTPGTREQRADEAIAITRSIEMGLPLAERDPEVFDVLKPQETFRELCEINGVPSKLMRSEKELQALNERRAEEQHREQQALEAAQQAETLRNLGGAARDISAAGVQ